MSNPSLTNQHLRLAELMACFSLAMDLGLGQPLEWVMRTCLLGVRLSELLGLSEVERRQVYYVSLLRHIGCTATAAWEAEVFGNELKMGEALVTDATNPLEAMRFLLRTPGQGLPLAGRWRYLGKALAAGPAMKEEVDQIQCEVAGLLADRLGFDQPTRQVLGQVFERWDGKGTPHKLKGEELALPVRVVHLAHDMVTMQLMAGSEKAVMLAQKRAGRLYDPTIVETFCRAAPELFDQLDHESIWETLLLAEPGTSLWLSETEFDNALLVIADFGDLKSPFFAGHSRAVATLVKAAAQQINLPKTEANTLRQAALLHDLGKVGISAGIWGKPGPLTESEWERVRMHPYLTERILIRAGTFAPLVDVAVLHHERLDGSGYHRRLPGTMLSVTARLLAAANAYQALTEPRAYRPAFSPDEAATAIHQQKKAGKLDAMAVDAVLNAAGHQARPVRSSFPGALSQREMEVLRLLVQGLTNRQMAKRLVISQKTVGHHVQHIYNKLGVSSRAAATLFAMQHNLLPDFDR